MPRSSPTSRRMLVSCIASPRARAEPPSASRRADGRHEQRQHHRAHAPGDEVGVGQQVGVGADGAAGDVPPGAVEQFVERARVEPVLGVCRCEALPEQHGRRAPVERGIKARGEGVEVGGGLLGADLVEPAVGHLVHGAAVEVDGGGGEARRARQKAGRERERAAVVAEGAPQQAVLVAARAAGVGRRKRELVQRVHAHAGTRASASRCSAAGGTAVRPRHQSA